MSMLDHMPAEGRDYADRVAKGHAAEKAHVDGKKGRDANGAEVGIGDLVTLNLKITGVHDYLDPATGSVGGQFYNVAYLRPGGNPANAADWRHYGSVKDTYIRKA